MIAIIVQARMTSSRLPGKILKTVQGKPLLAYQVERLRRIPLADAVVIATTGLPSDTPVAELCESLGVSYFRGSEEDVLARYYQAAKQQSADVVVRVTGDCPLIDPGAVNHAIQYYLDHRDTYDYVRIDVEHSFPRGMDAEVFSFSMLEEAYHCAKSQMEREHVTPYFYLTPSRFRVGRVAYDQDCSRFRFTVDTMEDFQLVSNILETLYPVNPNFTLEDCLRLMEKHPEWETVNSHVQQKKLDQ